MIKTAVCFIFSCLIITQLDVLPSRSWLWLAPVAAILFSFKRARLLAIILSASLWCLFRAGEIIDSRLHDDLIGQDITIQGEITSIPKQQNKRLQFQFKPSPHSSLTLPKKLQLNWYQPFPNDLRAGDLWEITVRLKPPHGLSNPGGFDYESWLFQNGIGATGYVRPKAEATRLHSKPNYTIEAIRHTLLAQIETQLSDSDNIGVIQALTTGVRDNISLAQWQLLQQTGTSHLVAISGLHIGLIATLGFFLFRFVWSLRASNLLILPANSFGAIAGLALAIFYAALAGFAIPTQRALIMVATVTLAIIIRRPIAASDVLATAIVLILIVDPLSVLSAGFWLSCFAVGIILFISQNRYPAQKKQWLKIHVLIALGLSPLLILFFKQTSLIAPVANLITVPLVSIFVVPLVLLASLVSYIYTPLASLLFAIADYLLDIFWQGLSFLAEIPLAHISVSIYSDWYWPILLVATFVLLSPRNFPAKWLSLVLLLPLLTFTPEKPKHDDFWFTLLDVGQGLAAVIETEHHTLLFDTGSGINDQLNSGKTVIVPFLRERGINLIDTLVVSHSDNDHIGGAQYILNSFQVNKVLTSDSASIRSASSCLSGQSWQWDDVTFAILSPALADRGSKNNLSCVLRVSNRHGSVLLTGDIERLMEKQLSERYGQALKSTVMVAPHHGSKTSSTSSFIKNVAADFILFPTGYLNRYRFPNNNVAQRYKLSGAELFNTATQGAILMRLNDTFPQNITVWRTKTQKIWTHLATD